MNYPTHIRIKNTAELIRQATEINDHGQALCWASDLVQVFEPESTYKDALHAIMSLHRIKGNMCPHLMALREDVRVKVEAFLKEHLMEEDFDLIADAF